MRVLITGITGFFGSYLLEAILEKTDWEVIGLYRHYNVGTFKRIEHLKKRKDFVKRVQLIWHDLNDPLLQSEIHPVLYSRINYIIHTAAISSVDFSINKPKDTILNNIKSTINILEFARWLDSLNSFVYFSTDESFGPAEEGVNHTEYEPHRPSNPYAASKAASEDIAYSYARTYSMPILITHTMNLFGARQHPDKLIPKTIMKFLKEKVMTIHGKDESEVGSRKWIHCSVAADALIYLLQNNICSGSVNIVGEKEVNNLEIVKKIADIMDYVLMEEVDMSNVLYDMTVKEVKTKMRQKIARYKFVDFHSTRPGHDMRYSLSNKKLKKLGYKYIKHFDEMLEETVKWYQDNPKWLRA